MSNLAQLKEKSQKFYEEIAKRCAKLQGEERAKCIEQVAKEFGLL